MDSEKNKEAIDKIIASTNSQNAVPPVLLRATDEIQRKIEIFFLHKGYFYDRRKNYYKNMGKPAAKIFTIQSLAQAVQAIIHTEPDTARAKPTTLIKTKESYEKIFNDTISFEIDLTCSLIAKSVRDYIRLELSKENKSLGNINLDKITKEMHDKNFEIVKELIKDFKTTSSTVSDSSVSKSGKFRDYFNTHLEAKYPA